MTLPTRKHSGLSAELAASFARLALSNITQAYPYKLDHVLTGLEDACHPRDVHPAFYGSYDWHSAVHMHWLLARLLHLNPQWQTTDLGEKIMHALCAHLTPAHMAIEAAYFQRPSAATFERTYGWAWVLKLQTALLDLAADCPPAGAWAQAVQPLADEMVARYQAFLPIAAYPIRAGTHANSAFALLLALDYAQSTQHFALRKLLTQKALQWFGKDQRYPANYEPSGDDFLSGGLMQAALMRRVVDGCSFADWWAVFCPAPHALQTWLSPVPVSDRSDAKLSHLDGLNLSRAWCWRLLLPELPAKFQAPVQSAISDHLAAALPQAASGNYMGTHWLASFAVLALVDP
ncbi:MAG: DUF2891 domain-containing protein [Chitinophagaceae bacterium]|nr:DUF2891 domain-containing protein [Polaromonas sp.]